MDIRVIAKPIMKEEAKEVAKEFFVDMVKGVVDVEKEIIALGGEWHIDANMVLVNNGSEQKNVWGFNFYPDENRVHCVSLINIRPLQNNRAIHIQDADLRERMEEIIHKLIV